MTPSSADQPRVSRTFRLHEAVTVKLPRRVRFDELDTGRFERPLTVASRLPWSMAAVVLGAMLAGGGLVWLVGLAGGR